MCFSTNKTKQKMVEANLLNLFPGAFVVNNQVKKRKNNPFVSTSFSFLILNFD